MKLVFVEKFHCPILDRNLYDISYLEKPVGSKLVGLKINGSRPKSVEFSRQEIVHLIEHPEYLEHIKNALGEHNDTN